MLKEQKDLNELNPGNDELSIGEKRFVAAFIPGVTARGRRVQYRKHCTRNNPKF